MLSRLCAQFDLVAVCQLTSRTEWIGTAEERGCLIFAEGRSAKGSASWETIQYGEHARDSASGEGQSIGGVEKLMAASHEMTELGEFSIGAVTGRNSVFLLSEQERVAFGIQNVMFDQWYRGLSTFEELRSLPLNYVSWPMPERKLGYYIRPSSARA